MARSLRPSRPALVVGAVGLALVVLLVALTFGLGGAAGFGPFRRGGTDPAGAAVVVRVVDGDTLVVDVGGHEEDVRLIGIDTPETVAPERPVECFGAEASERLAELLPAGTAVRLERDVEPRDRYDRLLAYVFRSDDGLFVNLAQVEGGFAEAMEYPPNTARRPELDAAERSARAAGAGLWGTCGDADTPVVPATPGGSDDVGEAAPGDG
jgi:micrococcal nuclease